MTQLTFHKPVLPPYLESVTIKGLMVGNTPIDLEITRHGDDNMGDVNWKNKPEGWRLLVIK